MAQNVVNQKYQYQKYIDWLIQVVKIAIAESW